MAATNSDSITQENQPARQPASVPVNTQVSTLSTQDSLSRRRVNLTVFSFSEKSFPLLQVEKTITANEIVQKIIQELHPSQIANARLKDVFSLWMVSDHLEIQLKSYHEPVKLYRKWSQLLTQYTTTPKHKCEKDKPSLYFRRNAFLNLSMEQDLVRSRQYPEATNLLYYEALHNSTDGHYPPFVCAEAAELAIYNCAIKRGHDFELASINATNFLPKCVCVSSGGKPGTKIKTRDQLKGCDIDDALQTAYSKFKEQNLKEIDKIQVKFLETCWSKDYYGSVMFRALVERKKTSNPLHFLVYTDRSVYIAVNPNYIHILRDEDKDIMLRIKMSRDLKCEFQPATEEGEHFYSSVWLEFDSPSKIENHVQRLQIFSRQAPLIDAMVNRCKDEAVGLVMGVASTDTVTEGQDTSGITSTRSCTNDDPACTDSTKAFVCKTYVKNPDTGDKVKMSLFMSVKNSLKGTHT